MIFIILLMLLAIIVALIILFQGVYNRNEGCILISLILALFCLSIAIGMKVDIFEYFEKYLLQLEVLWHH